LISNTLLSNKIGLNNFFFDEKLFYNKKVISSKILYKIMFYHISINNKKKQKINQIITSFS